MDSVEVLQALARQDERINNLEKRAAESAEVISSIHKIAATVEHLGNQIEKQNRTLEKIYNKQNEHIDALRSEMDERFKEQGTRIGNLAGKPGERAEKGWESIKAAAITAIISVLITAMVTYFLINVGPY